MADIVGELARADVMIDMLDERAKAFERWGDQSERGDVLWADIVAARTNLIDDAIRDNVDSLYTEVIQAATILMAWAENLKREDTRGKR